MKGQLQKAEKAAVAQHDKAQREQAARFCKHIQSGVFLKQPKAVTLIATKKKRKTLKTETIRSADEEDEFDGRKSALSQHGKV